jgi:hypothetical protein
MALTGTVNVRLLLCFLKKIKITPPEAKSTDRPDWEQLSKNYPGQNHANE